LGTNDPEGAIILIAPDTEVTLGERMH